MTRRHQAPWRRMPPGLRLLLDVALVALLFALDARDLWFKMHRLGPRDTFSFAGAEPRSLQLRPSAAPLRAATAFAFADQPAQRSSGWSSFLQRCDSLSPLLDSDGANVHPKGLHHVVGKNCRIGATDSATRASELVLTSSVRADSMAWTACKLLYRHRKPPICHSPIVKHFSARYDVQGEPSMLAFPPSASKTDEPVVVPSGPQEDYSATPGSSAEMELVELLSVISKSSPVSAVVCVEGFVNAGPGRYTATIFGCGSPSYYRSAFVGREAVAFAQFQQDKAWLTADILHFMGMKFLVRENRRSVFTVRKEDRGTGGGLVLEHAWRLNFSTSGSLYTFLLLADLALLLLNLYSVLEIARVVVWPLWKPLVAADHQSSAARISHLEFVLEDYAGVLRVSLLRSTPVAVLTIISRLLSWLFVLPSTVLWTDGHVGTEDMYALLSVLRVWVLVLLCVNAFWDALVALNEKRALAIVRETYVRPQEVAAISALVAVGCLLASLPALSGDKRLHDGQRILDSKSFVDATLFANTFPAQQDSLQNTPMDALFVVYGPLAATIGWSSLLVAVLAAARFFVSMSKKTDGLAQQANGADQPGGDDAASNSAGQGGTKDVSSIAGILMRSSSMSAMPGGTLKDNLELPTIPASAIAWASGKRLPVEEMVDIPIRARSLVRHSWAMKKQVGLRVILLPAYYLEHGIMLVGSFMKTRCGFIDVVQPLVHANEHEPPKDKRTGKHMSVVQLAQRRRSLGANIQQPLR